MKYWMLVLLLSGCSTFETNDQHAYVEELSAYNRACHKWREERIQHLANRTPDEQWLPLVDFLAKRCKEDPFTCTPPAKSGRMIDLEQNWGKPYTQPGCVDEFKNPL